MIFILKQTICQKLNFISKYYQDTRLKKNIGNVHKSVHTKVCRKTVLKMKYLVANVAVLS